MQQWKSSTIRRLAGWLILPAFLALACGPITEDDLYKWSQNDEGLKRHSELMEDPDVPLKLKVRSIVILTEKGWSDRIRGIIKKYEEPQVLADEASTPLIGLLENDDKEIQDRARNSLFKIMPLMGDEARDEVQKAISKWAFGSITQAMTREQVWDLISNKIALPQIVDLGEYPVESVFLMIERRVESDAWKLIDWVEYIFSFENEAYNKKALAALKVYHQNLFKQIDANPDGGDTFFEPSDIAVVEKFNTPEAVLYILDLAQNPHVDPVTQNQALLIAERMYDIVLSKEEQKKHVDQLLAVVMQKLPHINDRTGMARLNQAKILLEKTGIPGLKDVPLVIEKEVKGKKSTQWKIYMGSNYYTPSRFIYGVATDFLEPLVESERDTLKKEWLEELKKKKAAEAKAAEAEAAEAPAGEKKAEAKEEKKAEAKEEKKAEAKKDDTKEEKKAEAAVPEIDEEAAFAEFELDPKFRTELNVRVDKSVTPIVERWLDSEVKLAKILALAGLKYLGTPKAKVILEAASTQANDFSAYLGKGITMGLVAKNALKGIELSQEFEELRIKAIQEKLLSPKEVEGVRQRMLADLVLTADELEKKYREEIQKRKDRYLEQKRKLEEYVRKYQKAIRWICYNQIDKYPTADQEATMDRYIKNTSLKCQKEAEKQLSKEKLDWFGFNEDAYKGAVVLGIMKKEITRKYLIRAKARLYLKTAIAVSLDDKQVESTIKRTRKWDVTDPYLRKAIDKFVTIALDMAKDDFEKKNGGISAADLAEYRNYLESPEKFALATIILYRDKLEWTDTDEATQKRTVANIFAPAAKAAFDAKKYFAKQPEMVDYFMENYDDLWFVFQDVAANGVEKTRKSWNIPDEGFKNYATVATKIDALVKDVVAQAVKDEKLSQDEADAFLAHYPVFDTILDTVLAELDSIHKVRMEEEKKKAEEAKKAEAAKAAKEGKKAVAPKKADAPKADAPKADAPKADAPKADAPKADAPKADAPKADAPKAEAEKETKAPEKAPAK